MVYHLKDVIAQSLTIDSLTVPRIILVVSISVKKSYKTRVLLI